MELNREKIIKALGYCTTSGSCAICPYYKKYGSTMCFFKLKEEALSLINELTEENERLRAKNTKELLESSNV